VWIYDLERHSFSRLTFEGDVNGSPILSPDNKWIVFQSTRSGLASLYRQPPDGSGPAEQVTTETRNPQQASSWSPDGSVLTFTEARENIWILPMDGEGEPRVLIPGGAWAAFSPDGQWLAYVASEEGQLQVYVTRYPEADVKFLVSGEEGGAEPVWSPNGSELFYRSGDRMMVVSVQTEPVFSAGKSTVLFEGSYVSHPSGFQYYDISPDGQRFLMIKEDQTTTAQINVVLNWFEELKRLVPTN
jgi:Tol biopolymer transport system component